MPSIRNLADDLLAFCASAPSRAPFDGQMLASYRDRTTARMHTRTDAATSTHALSHPKRDNYLECSRQASPLSFSLRRKPRTTILTTHPPTEGCNVGSLSPSSSQWDCSPIRPDANGVVPHYNNCTLDCPSGQEGPTVTATCIKGSWGYSGPVLCKDSM